MSDLQAEFERLVDEYDAGLEAANKEFLASLDNLADSELVDNYKVARYKADLAAIRLLMFCRRHRAAVRIVGASERVNESAPRPDGDSD